MRLKAVAGVQYYNVPSVSWTADNTLPKVIRDALQASVRDLNRQIQSLSDIYPSAALVFTVLS